MNDIYLMEYSSTRYYPEGGSDSHKEIIRADTSIQALYDWWNATQLEKCLKYAWQHKSYHHHIPPIFVEGTHLSLPSHGGGGCSSNSSVRILKQE